MWTLEKHIWQGKGVLRRPSVGIGLLVWRHTKLGWIYKARTTVNRNVNLYQVPNLIQNKYLSIKTKVKKRFFSLSSFSAHFSSSRPFHKYSAKAYSACGNNMLNCREKKLFEDFFEALRKNNGWKESRFQSYKSNYVLKIQNIYEQNKFLLQLCSE